LPWPTATSVWCCRNLFVFGTIAENIALRQAGPSHEIVAAARAAHA
jgi:ABC-type multidrug transport system fused ATPase/permease subunit